MQKRIIEKNIEIEVKRIRDYCEYIEAYLNVIDILIDQIIEWQEKLDAEKGEYYVK